MRCLLTDTEGKGVKAHIIPKSFYDLDYSQRVPLLVITNSDDGYNGTSFVGIYDSGIVTIEGEKVFNEWDAYAHQLLIRDREQLGKRVSGGDVIALEKSQYDYPKLKLFFLSLLWRASVSTQRFFRRVNVGPFEPTLREAILRGDPGDIDFFSTTLACFVDMPTRAAILDPFRERYERVSYYRFFLGNYIAYIKVDSQRTPAPFDTFALAPDRPLCILGRNFDTSKEKFLMRKLVIENAS
jgi:hypothetical protein